MCLLISNNQMGLLGSMALCSCKYYPNHIFNWVVNIKLNVYTMLTQWQQETTQVALEAHLITWWEPSKEYNCNTSGKEMRKSQNKDSQKRVKQGLKWKHTRYRIRGEHTYIDLHLRSCREPGSWRQEIKQPPMRPRKELDWCHQMKKRQITVWLRENTTALSTKRGGTSTNPKNGDRSNTILREIIV